MKRKPSQQNYIYNLVRSWREKSPLFRLGMEVSPAKKVLGEVIESLIGRAGTPVKKNGREKSLSKSYKEK